MIVSSCTPLGDTVAPHCCALLYDHVKEPPIDSQDEKKLAQQGVDRLRKMLPQSSIEEV
jgi:hypothetical protein